MKSNAFIAVAALHPCESLRKTISCGWSAIVPELDRLHVFLPESLELGRHWLVAVPESLSVLLSRFWLRDFNPGGKQQSRHVIFQNVPGTHNTTVTDGRIFQKEYGSYMKI